MNILLFVTSLLMILSLLTYARIDNYRYFMGMQSEFERYMRSMERLYINNSAENWYSTTKAKIKDAAAPPEVPAEPIPNAEGIPQPPQKVGNIDITKPLESNDSKKKPDEPGSPTSRLSLRILFNPKMRAANEDAYRQTREWTKQLMKNLYGKQKFFIEMMEKNSDFLNELLSYLETTINDISEDNRPKHAQDLANLDLEGDLWNAFYLMLKGCPKEELLADVHNEKKAKIIESGEGEEIIDEDENDDAEEATEYTSSQGYDSLLNYISMRNTIKVRIYLASRGLLTAIFGSPEVAERIIAMRLALYRSVLQDLSPADATKQFQVAFHGSESQEPNSMLDYKVTKTNPSNYD